jgi:hypothetical protein
MAASGVESGTGESGVDGAMGSRGSKDWLNDPGTTTAPRIMRQFEQVRTPSSFWVEHRSHFHRLAIVSSLF